MSVTEIKSDKVVTLRPADDTPDAEVVAEMTDLLAAAQRGEITGFALVALRSSRQCQYVIAGVEAKCNYLRLYGLLAWIQRLILERWEQLT